MTIAAAAGTAAALALEQRRLWFLERLHPGRSVLNAPVVVRLLGDLDVAALRDALAAVVRRHAPLRSVFDDADEPRCRILPEVDVDLPVRVLAAGQDWRHVIRDEVVRPFDLTSGPPLRAGLLRMSDRDHVLTLVAHHIVVDRWSLSLIFKELETFYRPGGPVGVLPPLTSAYADYVQAQREYLAGPRAEADLAYWRRQLGGAHATELPADRSRPVVARQLANHVTTLLPAEVAVELSAAASRLRATPFMVALAAIGSVLTRWTGDTDVCVGAPLTTRTTSGLAPLVGMFLNNVVLRTDLGGDPDLAEAVGRVRTTVVGALRHSNLPFAELVRDLRPARDVSRTPLFQVAVNMTNVPPVLPRLAGLECVPVEPPVPGANFDLTLYLDPVAEGLELSAVYDRDLYDGSTMDELVTQVSAVLTDAIRAPERPLRRHSLVTASARPVLPDPAQPLSQSWPGPVGHLVEQQAIAHPDRIAVRSPSGTRTYAEVRSAAADVAYQLGLNGVPPGEPVGVLAARHEDVAAAMIGALAAGTPFVMLDPAHPAVRLRRQVEAAGLRTLIATGSPADRPSWTGTLRRLSVRWPGGSSRTLSQADLERSSRAYLAFTSGTSGRPKAVVGNHGALTHFLPWQVETFGLGPDDRYSLLSGLSHDPLHRDVVTPLATGGCCVVPDPAAVGVPGRLAQWFRDEWITVAHLTPALADLIVAGTTGAEPITSLRLAFFTGEPLRRSQLDGFQRLFPHARCFNSYGTTETSRAVALHETRPGESGAVLPVGRGIPDVQLLVLNDSLDLAGIGEIGRLCFRSPFLASGYLGDDGGIADGAGFAANPFTERPDDRVYHTGDHGRYRNDGGVSVLGRVDQQVQIRGFRVEPREVQLALEEHEAVHAAVVITRRDPHGGTVLAAYAQLRAEASRTDLTAHLRRTLPDYMVPATVTILDRLPVTPNGKVDTAQLPEPQTDSADGTPPRTPVEKLLAELWIDLVDADHVTVEDDFFALGGHSITAMRFAARLAEETGLVLPLVDIFLHPTLGDLAALVVDELIAADRAGQERP
jgi:amino acid adenylation domain-containing protein